MVTEPSWRVPLVFRRTPQIAKGGTPTRNGFLASEPRFALMWGFRNEVARHPGLM